MEASSGRQSVGALLTLAAIGRGVVREAGARPLAPLFASAEGLATALRRLLPILQVLRPLPYHSCTVHLHLAPFEGAAGHSGVDYYSRMVRLRR